MHYLQKRPPIFSMFVCVLYPTKSVTQKHKNHNIPHIICFQVVSEIKKKAYVPYLLCFGYIRSVNTSPADGVPIYDPDIIFSFFLAKLHKPYTWLFMGRHTHERRRGPPYPHGAADDRCHWRVEVV